MHYSIYGFMFFIVLFVLIFASIHIGRQFGKGKSITPGLSVTEGAVFTLMAFLVALTFSSAHARFDARRSAITEEVNAISTAYLRLDLLKPADRHLLQQDILTYLSSRLATYEALPDIKLAMSELKQSLAHQDKIWVDAMKAIDHPAIAVAPMLIVPALNNMFDIAHTRISFSNLHLHLLILGLLIMITLLSATLVGYDMAGKGSWSLLHVFIYSITVTATIYIILDLEYPRFGMIQETSFDRQLYDLRDTLSQNSKT